MRHVKVFESDHKHVMQTVTLLKQLFVERAEYHGLSIRVKGKLRNIPGQPEAMQYFFAGVTMSEYVECLIQRAKGAQA